MWPLTARALASLPRDGRVSARVDVLHDGQLAQRLGGGGLALPPAWDPYAADFVPSLGGTVNVSRQQIGRDGTCRFLDLAGVLTPDDVTDLFVPMIAELRPWYGIHYWNATPAEVLTGTDIEWVPLATLVITGTDGTYPELAVSGFDRLWHLAQFVGNWAVAAGTPTHQALADLLASQIPASHLKLDIPTSEFTTGALLYAEQDQSIDVAHAMALAMGMRLYADPMGVVTAGPEASTEDPPAMVYEPGPDSMLLRPRRGIDATQAKNVFVFTGEAPDGTVVRGEFRDEDPESLTYWPRVGKRPKFDSSPLMRTAEQCYLAARTTAARELGVPDTIAVPIVTNPAHAAGDVLQVRDPDQRIDFPLIVDSFPVNLRAADGEQLITCRSRVIR